MMDYLRNTMTYPQFYISCEEELPLGHYGCELLIQLQTNYPERYWQLSFDGRLMKTLQDREKELLDLKISLMEEMEKKFPRPKTTDFLTIAAHMNLIDEQAEAVIRQELCQPL